MSSPIFPPVSVILPIRDEASSIAEVLAAVLAQDYPPDLIEAIVADGMSEDGTREIVCELAAQDPRLRLLDNPQRITPAGLNLGIRAARGDVIVRVDGHGVLPPNYVRECVAFLTGARSAFPLRLDRGEGQGEASLPAIVPDFSISAFQHSAFEGRPPSAALLAVGGAWDSVGRGYVGEGVAIAMSSKFGVGNSPFRTFDSREGPIQTDTVPYWAVRREVFNRIGLFREEMLCHEDYEFNCRLRSAGGTILLLPWLRAKYYVRSTLGGLAQQYWRYGIWKGRFLRAHPESLKVRHLIPPLFVAALAAGALASFLGSAGWLCLGSLVALYVGFLLAATASLACSRSRRRETAPAEAPAGRTAMSPSRRSQSPTDAPPADVSSPPPLLSAFQLFGFSTLRSALMLPLVLATLHLCWGSGVWVGLVRGKVAGQPPRLSK